MHAEVSGEQVQQLTGIQKNPVADIFKGGCYVVVIHWHLSVYWWQFHLSSFPLPQSDNMPLMRHLHQLFFSTAKTRLWFQFLGIMKTQKKKKKNMQQTNAPILVRWQQVFCKCSDVTHCWCTVMLLCFHSQMSFSNFLHALLVWRTGSSPSRWVCDMIIPTQSPWRE